MSLIESCELAVKNHQMIKYQKQSIDVQTANAILTVYNSLNEKNKVRFESLPLPKLIQFCWGSVV